MIHVLALSAVVALFAQAEKPRVIRENYPNGQPKEEYTVNGAGDRHGPYTMWHENTQKKLAGQYADGRKDGTWTEFAQTSGRPILKREYAKGVFLEATPLDEAGKPVAHLLVKDGVVSVKAAGAKTAEPAHPRTKDDITKRLAELEGKRFEEVPFEDSHSAEPPHKPGKLKIEYMATGLGRLNAYRWLSELNADLTLDPPLCDSAQHGAALMAALRTVTYTPVKPPDMASAFFSKGEKAVKNGLLVGNIVDLRAAVDFLVYDTNEQSMTNIASRLRVLGHTMKKTGFGEADRMVCIWTADKSSRAPVPDVVRYPGRGWIPSTYFKTDALWHATLGGKAPMPKADEVMARAFALTPEYDIEGEMEVDALAITERTIIYRPKLASPETARVFVVITGAGPRPLVHVTEGFKPVEAESE